MIFSLFINAAGWLDLWCTGAEGEIGGEGSAGGRTSCSILQNYRIRILIRIFILNLKGRPCLAWRATEEEIAPVAKVEDDDNDYDFDDDDNDGDDDNNNTWWWRWFLNSDSRAKLLSFARARRGRTNWAKVVSMSLHFIWYQIYTIYNLQIYLDFHLIWHDDLVWGNIQFQGLYECDLTKHLLLYDLISISKDWKYQHQVNHWKPGARSTNIKRASKGQLLDSGKRHRFYQTTREKEQENKEILVNNELDYA